MPGMGPANIFTYRKSVSVDLGTAPNSQIHLNMIKKQMERDKHLRDFSSYDPELIEQFKKIQLPQIKIVRNKGMAGTALRQVK